jgi:hypothetical protein
MQAQTLAVSRDQCDIELLSQEKPKGFEPALLNVAAAGGVEQMAC